MKTMRSALNTIARSTVAARNASRVHARSRIHQPIGTAAQSTAGSMRMPEHASATLTGFHVPSWSTEITVPLRSAVKPNMPTRW